MSAATKMKKLDTKTFIERARAVHGAKYDYSSTVYRLSTEKLTIICPEHGPFKMVANAHINERDRQGCAMCARKRTNAANRARTVPKYDRVAAGVDKFGDRYDYSNVPDGLGSKDMFDLVCREHGSFRVSWNRHLTYPGGGCSKCKARNSSKILRYTTENFVEAARRVHGDRYEYSQTHYVTTYGEVTIICAEHGPFTQTPINHLQSSHGCPECGLRSQGQFTGLTRQEVDCSEWLRSLGFDVENNVRLLRGRAEKNESAQEIDIWMPRENVGIEMHGLYWHSEKFQTERCHLIKTERAEAQGIKLLQVFEDEWRDKQQIVKNVILQRLGRAQRLQARKLAVAEIEYAAAAALHDTWHLQGSVRTGTAHIGLFDGENLVAAATFGRTRFGAEQQWELLRYSTAGFTIVGGLAKMLKLFSKGRAGTLLTYADRRWFTGSAYIAAGFASLGASAPGYFWTDEIRRLPRYQFQRSSIQRVIPSASSELSESENARRAGWRKIHDCGMLRFEKTLG